PIGILTAIKTGTWIDKLIISITTIFVSMPVFWLGFSLILLFSVKLNWLPVSGRGGFLNFILPSITLAVPFIGQYIEFVKKSILENIQNNLLENAILRGLKKRYIIFNYLLKGAWIPILSGFSFTFVSILTGSILVEEIFSWPGIGFLFTKAIQAGDVPLIQACIMVFGLLFIIATHFMNSILKYLDPRIKGEKNNG
ncbi:MAG: ABC transporter permease, partial [Fusobacterium periodonticum]|nr:ABC transporter permease [Fusobacterium periodonticum]